MTLFCMALCDTVINCIISLSVTNFGSTLAVYSCAIDVLEMNFRTFNHRLPLNRYGFLQHSLQRVSCSMGNSGLLVVSDHMVGGAAACNPADMFTYDVGMMEHNETCALILECHKGGNECACATSVQVADNSWSIDINI